MESYCAKFTIESIQNKENREAIALQLKNIVFDMRISRTMYSFGFATHPQFEGELFMEPGVFKKPGALSAGDVIQASVRIIFDDNTGKYKFNISEIHRIVGSSKTKKEIKTFPISQPAPQNDKAKQAQRKPVVVGKPSDDILKKVQSIGSLTEFGRNTDSFCVYIDEQWPGLNSQDPEKKNTAIMGGIVWEGKTHDSKILPLIKTHLRKETGWPQNAISALTNLLKCKRCFPFIMPISGREGNQKHYNDLVQRAIKLLLGWILPTNGKEAEVCIYFEDIDPRDPGINTDYFRGVLRGSDQNKKRYERWKIKEVEWRDKNFGYIPYADLICYFALEHNQKSIEIANFADYKKWAGYVPLSVSLVPILERMEFLESSGNVDDLLDFIDETHGTRLCRKVLEDVKMRIANSEDLKVKLLESLERRYEAKVRDLQKLSRLSDAVKGITGYLEPGGNKRTWLLWVASDLQLSNHEGDPERAIRWVEEYEQRRASIIEHDRELTAFVDLNLAVHYADLFEFEKSKGIINGMVEDPLFGALTPLNRGRAFSGLGQYHAMLGESGNAEKCFLKALELFDQAELSENERDAEKEQTSIYRAINALDCGHKEDLTIVSGVLGDIPNAAGQLAIDPSIKNAYKHHLLLRCLYQHKELRKPTASYIGSATQWWMGIQHPWPLIALYRAVLLAIQGSNYQSGVWFKKAIESATIESHGAVLRLISVMAASVANCFFNEEKFFNGYARRELETIKGKLPGAKESIATLERVLDEPKTENVDIALKSLPFNYH